MDHAPGSPSKYMTTIYNYFCIKNGIFRVFECKKNYENRLQNAPNCTPPKKNSCPPLANPAYAHELLLRNLFENPPWQTVDCV